MKAKKFLSLLLALCMVFSLMPAMSLTAGATDNAAGTFAELQAKINEATSGGTVKLQKDYLAGSEEGRIVIAGKNLTLDLNGHIIDRGLFTPDDYLEYAEGIFDEEAEEPYAAEPGYEDGGVIFVQGAALTITDSSTAKTGTITGGNTRTYGGGILVNNDASLTMTGGAIIGNRAHSGGAIYHWGYTTTKKSFSLENVTIANNIAYHTDYGKEAGDGGGLFINMSDKLTIKGCTIENNIAACGGGVYSLAITETEILENTSFSGNKACVDNTDYSNKAGGAVYCKQGALTVDQCTFSNNFTYGSGAALFIVDADCTVSDTEIVDNEWYDNGAIYHIVEDWQALQSTAPMYSLTLTRVNIHHNGKRGHDDGCGAVYLDRINAELQNVKINNNQYYGGAFYASHCVIDQAENVEIKDNSTGCAINLYDSTMKLENSTVSNNTPGETALDYSVFIGEGAWLTLGEGCTLRDGKSGSRLTVYADDWESGNTSLPCGVLDLSELDSHIDLAMFYGYYADDVFGSDSPDEAELIYLGDNEDVNLTALSAMGSTSVALVNEEASFSSDQRFDVGSKSGRSVTFYPRILTAEPVAAADETAGDHAFDLQMTAAPADVSERLQDPGQHWKSLTAGAPIKLTDSVAKGGVHEIRVEGAGMPVAMADYVGSNTWKIHPGEKSLKQLDSTEFMGAFPGVFAIDLEMGDVLAFEYAVDFDIPAELSEEGLEEDMGENMIILVKDDYSHAEQLFDESYGSKIVFAPVPSAGTYYLVLYSESTLYDLMLVAMGQESLFDFSYTVSNVTLTHYTFDQTDRGTEKTLPYETISEYPDRLFCVVEEYEAQKIGDKGSVAAQRLMSSYAIPFTLRFVDGDEEALPYAVVKADCEYQIPTYGAEPEDGMVFLGWATEPGGSVEYANGVIEDVTESMTLYAVWGQKLNVTLTNLDGYGDDKTVVLIDSNGTPYPMEQVEGTNTYTASAPLGTYNVKVTGTKSGKGITKTVLAEFANSDAVEIGMPSSGAHSSVVDTEDAGAYAGALVGGLDEIAAKAASDDVVEIKLTVNKTVVPGEKAAIKAEAEKFGKQAKYVDLTLTKQVGTGEPEDIGNDNDQLLTIIVPFDTTGKTDFVVYRYHDSDVQTLTTTANDAGEKIEVGEDSVTIFAKKFSTYAIGYTTGNNSSSHTGGSGGSTSNAVTVPASVEHGKVSADRKYASSGETVTVTVTPDKGYTLETLTVKDAKGKEIALTKTGDTTYTFKMPGSKVTVEATFMEDNSMLNFFVDVKATDYYYDAVLWAAENGITSGTDATHFSPEMGTTRAQVVTFLWRAAGCPEPKSMNSFADVVSGSYYEKAVAWAIEQGITKGTSATTFSPNSICTRAQIAAFMARYAGVADADCQTGFTDVSVNAYYASAVAWMLANGVTEGTTATTYSPDADCTRAQIVTFLYRLLGNK